jgi:uncharacterized protein YndB with AHSA1/START domain
MTVEFEVSDLIPAPPEVIYYAWLDSEEHSRMTGSDARITSKDGEKFQAWDGYIDGSNVSLEPHHRIVQRWRTSEFSDEEGDSLLEIILESEGDGTRITIRHSELPEHGMQYKQGWIDAYFTPMKAYYGGDR